MSKIFWGKEMMARQRLGPRIVDGKFLGRPLIERDTRISGGVYISQNARLAIRVDADSFAISSLYEKVLKEAGKSFMLDQISERVFLDHVSVAVKETIKSDTSGFLETMEEFINASDHKISLDDFIEMGIGDCRIFALLSGVLIEKLIDDRFIAGKVSIDRNVILNFGGHVWARFENTEGKVTIVDIANDYIGPEEGGPWIYKRPE